MSLHKRIVVLIVCLVAIGLVWAQRKMRRIPLPSSKMLMLPAPGTPQRTNSFPTAIAVSPDQRYIALLNDGYGTQEALARQSISVVDLSNNRLTDFPDPRFGEDAHQSLFLGLVFSSDGKHLYASVGSITDPTGVKAGNLGNGIAIYSVTGSKVSPERFISIPPQHISAGKKVSLGVRNAPGGKAISYPAGIALISHQGTDQLLVANNLSDNVVLLDVTTGRILKSFDVSTSKLVPSSFPYTVVATRDGRRAWCSLWNASQVVELDLTAGKVVRWIPLQKPKEAIAPGSHPTALLLSHDEKLLYVALSNADSVAVLDTATGRPTHFLDASISSQKASGAFPIGLALSGDGARLLVAAASLNSVAVFETKNFVANTSDEERQPALGFIPTEWYTSAVAVVGDDLMIATAKGQGSGPNDGFSESKIGNHKKEHPYIPTLIGGSIARIPLRDVYERLADFTKEAEEDNLFRTDPGKIQFAGGQNLIRHVIYVLKENRTYDQVFGDLPVGNGDSSLTMYGAEITPNQHKLALQFGVLDNFYDSGEVSGDGHMWSTAAITTDYNERTWPIAYRGNERTYDFQGTVADEYPMDNEQSDVNDPATGFLWDNLQKNGVSYRIYGEFVTASWCKPEKVASPKQGTPSSLTSTCKRALINKSEPLPANVGQPHGSPSPFPWSIPVLHSVRPNKAALRDHFDPLYPDFNTDYPDQLRADEFLNEFGAFVRAREEGKGPTLPSFVLLYLPDDHTGGTRPGKPTPNASVADNDLALGRVVEAVSHSPYWDDTAILVVEDDAQDGADHVDAHRSTALVISKYSPGSRSSPYVDSRFYTTVSMIHTMEQLLGLPPMNQNDAWAPVIATLFTGAGKQPPFQADTSNRDNGLIYTVNAKTAPGAKESTGMDFTRPDAARASVLNGILWQASKGSAPRPISRHGYSGVH